jgi:hypothetical protein
MLGTVQAVKAMITSINEACVEVRIDMMADRVVDSISVRFTNSA